MTKNVYKVKPNHMRILYFLERDGPLTTAKLCYKTFQSDKNIRPYLSQLIEWGYVSRSGGVTEPFLFTRTIKPLERRETYIDILHGDEGVIIDDEGQSQ